MSASINEDKATTFVIKNNGLLYGSGLNNYGQLGNNSTSDINSFTLIPLPLNEQCKIVNNGLYHTGVITTDGKLYMCGANNFNQLSSELNIDKSLGFINVDIPDNKELKTIVCGGNYSILHMKDGTIYGCGANEKGQLGLNSINTSIKLFQRINTPRNELVKKVICGYDFTVILSDNGRLYGTGNNTYGQLGINNYSDQVIFTLITVPYNKEVKEICCGYRHMIVQTTDDSLYITGYYNGTNLMSLQNVSLPDNKICANISCGKDFTCITTIDGLVYAMGVNNLGQLGTNNNNNYTTLTLIQLSNDEFIKNITCGYNHTCIISELGNLYVTGNNDNGELGIGNPNTSINSYISVPISNVMYISGENNLNKLIPEYNVKTIINKTYTDSSFNLLFESNSDSLVTYTSSDNTIAIVDNNGNVTILQSGIVSINIIQIESIFFLELNVNVTVNILKNPNTLSTKSNVYNVYLNDNVFNLYNEIITNSDQEVEYTLSNNLASISSQGIISLLNPGIINISIFQNENNKYQSGTCQINLIINKIQTKINTQYNIIEKNYGSSKFNLDVISNNISPIVYQSLNTNIITINSSGEVNIVGIGNTSIILSQPETDQYSSINLVIPVNIIINRIETVISGVTEYTKITNSIPFNLDISSNSDAVIQYSIDNPDIISIDKYGTVKIYKSGTVLITVYQSSTQYYTEASKIITLNIIKKATELVVSPLITMTINSNIVNVNASSNNTSEKQYTIMNTEIATIDKTGNITPIKPGTTELIITQSETDIYSAATAKIVIIINKENNTITTKKSYYYLSITNTSFDLLNEIITNSTAKINFQLSNPSIAKLNDNGTITPLQLGSLLIYYYQDKNDLYLHGQGSFIITITKELTVINSVNLINKKLGDIPFNLNIISNSNAPIMYSSSDLNVVTVDQTGNVTIVDIGSVNIIISQNENNNYTGIMKFISINVTKNKIITQIIVNSNNYNKTTADTPFNLNIISNSNAPIMYSSSNLNVVTVDQNGLVTIVGAGATDIIVQQNENDSYTSISQTIKINITTALINNVITVNSIINKLITDTSFNLNASSISDTAKAYSSSNLSVVRVDNLGNIEIVGVGQSLITIIQQSTEKYTSAIAIVTITILKIKPIITVNKQKVVLNKKVKKYNIKAVSNSNSPLVYLSSNPKIVKVNRVGKVSIVGVGKTTIKINQLENNLYNATSTIIYFTIKK